MNHNDKQEIEWQYDVLDLRPVARRLDRAARDRAFGEFEVESLGEKTLSDTYLDTEDWRVFRAGYALRIRHRSGTHEKFEAAMKLLSQPSTNDGPRVRREISEPLKSKETTPLAASEGPVGARLRPLTGCREVLTLFEVQTRRATYRISPKTKTPRLSGDHEKDLDHIAPSAEVALDETRIPVHNGEPVSMKRIEVEIEAGDQEDFAAFIGEIVTEFRLTSAATSKFEAGLFALELTPPETPDFGPKKVSSKLTTGEAAYAVLRDQLEVFLSHEPGTRIGEDAKPLHDMRVASRRMRAAMRVFRAALPLGSARFEDELKWIASFLGEVRDLDVQLGELDALSSDAAPEDRASLEDLHTVLERSREKARRNMLRSLDSRRYSRFIEAYSVFLLRGPSSRSVGAGIPLSESGPVIIRKAYRKFRKLGDGLTKSSTDAEYHALRKRGKRLRYAIEFLAPVYETPAKDMISILKSIQDVLGDHQDAVVASDKLRELAPRQRKPNYLPPRTLFLMGGVSARHEARAEDLKRGFPKAYAGIKGKPWKRLKREMEEVAEAIALSDGHYESERPG